MREAVSAGHGTEFIGQGSRNKAETSYDVRDAYSFSLEVADLGKVCGGGGPEISRKDEYGAENVLWLVDRKSPRERK